VANFIWYGEALEGLLKGSIDFDTDTFKLALLDADYVFNQDTHDFFDDVSAEQITGTGYTAGGVTLSGVTVAFDGTSNEARVLWDDASWATATFACRYGVIYKETAGAASTDPLVACADLGAQSVTAATFSVDFTTSVLKLTAAAS
jgi:hypothetical protein